MDETKRANQSAFKHSGRQDIFVGVISSVGIDNSLGIKKHDRPFFVVMSKVTQSRITSTPKIFSRNGVEGIELRSKLKKVINAKIQ
jgi:hypothetical protein